jgi:hypothetical protein
MQGRLGGEVEGVSVAKGCGLGLGRERVKRTE